MIWDRLVSSVTGIAVNVGTLPYRLFRQNTLFPYCQLCPVGESDAEMAKVIAHWWERKLYELQYIQTAVRC